MTKRRPFKKIKLQWFDLLSADKELSDNAVRVAARLLTYINGQTEKAWPSYKTLSHEIGKSVDTIRRAIRELELGGWFDIERGNGSGQNTTYTPTEKSILRACELREKTGKDATLNPSKGSQICEERVANRSDKGWQVCHPNLENKINIKPRTCETGLVPLYFRIHFSFNSLFVRI